MSFATFAANAGDLWFPAMDDIACVLHSAGQLLVLVLDHEELITLSRPGASPAARHPRHAGHKSRVRDGLPGSQSQGQPATAHQPGTDDSRREGRLFDDLSAKPDICNPLTAGSPDAGSQRGANAGRR